MLCTWPTGGQPIQYPTIRPWPSSDRGSQNYYGVLISQAQADFAIPIVDRISRDRISDIACNLLKSFLVDYTIHQSAQYAAAAYRFRKGHTEFDEADRKWYWVARGKTSDLHTKSPENSKYQPK